MFGKFALCCALGLCALVSEAQSVHRVVVEVTSSGSSAFSSTLKNIENMIKAFGNEKVEVEFVCHGPGIDLLLREKNALSPRIQALQKSGARFAACSNTMKSRKLTPQRLLPGTVVVDAGTAEVVRKQEQGWSYLKR